MSAIPKRQLGTSDLYVTPVALGCWPISGMTSLAVNDADSRRTIQAAIDSGINHLDTAYSYGANGESERLIGEVAHANRDELVIASKGGVHWTAELERVVDGRAETLIRQCNESLARLGMDSLDVYYLHAPDPKIEITQSAVALKGLVDQGKTRAIGVSNIDFNQLREFSEVIKPDVVQLPFNMLQQSIREEIVPWCEENQVSVAAYWPLMKGLLGGHLRRNHAFDARDKRLTYPMYQGQEWKQNQILVDELEIIAKENDISIAALVVSWTIEQPGITVALCGAKREWQIRETAAAMSCQLEPDALQRIDAAISRRREAGITGY